MSNGHGARPTYVQVNGLFSNHRIGGGSRTPLGLELIILSDIDVGDGKSIHVESSAKYLGSALHSNGKDDTDVAARVVKKATKVPSRASGTASSRGRA